MTPLPLSKKAGTCQFNPASHVSPYVLGLHIPLCAPPNPLPVDRVLTNLNFQKTRNPLSRPLPESFFSGRAISSLVQANDFRAPNSMMALLYAAFFLPLPLFLFLSLSDKCPNALLFTLKLRPPERCQFEGTFFPFFPLPLRC